jgi:undecaprenyl-diphosphatase
MAYSRIYLGVHFISDIIPGIIVGVVFGYLVYRLYKKVHQKMMEQAFISEVPIYTLLQKRMITGGILVVIMTLIVFNSQLVSLLH